MKILFPFRSFVYNVDSYGIYATQIIQIGFHFFPIVLCGNKGEVLRLGSNQSDTTSFPKHLLGKSTIQRIPNLQRVVSFCSSNGICCEETRIGVIKFHSHEIRIFRVDYSGRNYFWIGTNCTEIRCHQRFVSTSCACQSSDSPSSLPNCVPIVGGEKSAFKIIMSLKLAHFPHHSQPQTPVSEPHRLRCWSWLQKAATS